MKTLLFSLALTAFGSAAAHAGCYADYKAKKDDPLRLHYGVIQIEGACTKSNAQAQIAPKIAQEGWQILTVLTTFNEGGLDERRANAGEYFLRF
jgi:hypothetical protein